MITVTPRAGLSRSNHGSMKCAEDTVDALMHAIDMVFGCLEHSDVTHVRLELSDEKVCEVYTIEPDCKIEYDDDTGNIVTLALIQSRYELYKMKRHEQPA